MKNNPTSTSKIRDIAIGFVGWILFINLYFIILFNFLIEESSRMTLFLGLPTIGVPILFFARKRTWIGVGILTAILISTTFWTALFLKNGGLPADSFQETLEVMAEVLFIPFPAGALLAMN